MSDKPPPWWDAVGSNPGFFFGGRAHGPGAATLDVGNTPRGRHGSLPALREGLPVGGGGVGGWTAALADVRSMDRIAHGRSDALTAEQRSEIAKKAAAKRWDPSKQGHHRKDFCCEARASAPEDAAGSSIEDASTGPVQRSSAAAPAGAKR